MGAQAALRKSATENRVFGCVHSQDERNSADPKLSARGVRRGAGHGGRKGGGGSICHDVRSAAAHVQASLVGT